jgi:hypothetical protein
MATNGRSSKAKGYRGETEFVEAAHEGGFLTAERNGSRYGSKDRGDIAGVPDWTIQVKSVARYSIPEWLRDAKEQAENGSTRWYGLALKLTGKHMREGAFLLPIAKWLELLRYIEELQEDVKYYRRKAEEGSR